MRDLNAAGQNLVRSLTRALSSLHHHFEKPDDAHLAVVEDAIYDMLLIHRVVVLDVESGKKGRISAADAGRMYRVMVVFRSLMAIFEHDLKTASGASWGAHLFSTADFAPVVFEEFEPPTSPPAVQRILADQVADMLEAASDATKLGLSYVSFAMRGQLEEALDGICTYFKTTRKPPLTIDFWDAEAVRRDLGLADLAAVHRLAARREILSVETWSGETMYPQFQFHLGKILPKMSRLAKSVPESLSGWPLTVFAYEHRDEPDGFFKNTLEPRGLWTASWGGKATNQFKHVDGKPEYTIAAGSPLYRVARTGYSPFFFASTPKRLTKDKTSGRFDLPHNLNRGTVYTAETPRGAWREVLDREPIVTLSSLLGRTMWTLSPMTSLHVGDITGGASSALASTPLRADTRQLAERLSNIFKGLRYPLRTTMGDKGIALFGPAGPTLPNSANLGMWASESVDGFGHDALWEYIAFREKHEKSFPVVLRRFPAEITPR